MDNTSLQKIKDALAKSTSIGIVVGRDPSLDHMASALSLYLLLKQVNKQVVVASPSEPLVEISSLVGIDKVQTNLGGDAGDLVVSFPYLEGEIEKVSYTLENSFLNIIVKAGEHGLSFDEKDVRYVRGSGSVDLLFVIGTPRLSDLGELLGGDKLRDAKIINIDNKAENQGFGDIVLVSPQASSVSEQIGDLVLSLGFHIDQDAAQNMLNGIIDATKDFQDPTTSSLAFEIGGILMKQGAKRVREQAATSAFTPRLQEEKRPQSMFQQEQQQLEEKRNQLQSQTQRDEEQNKPVQKPDDGKAPIDWLAPKVYKGSSNF